MIYTHIFRFPSFFSSPSSKLFYCFSTRRCLIPLHSNYLYNSSWDSFYSQRILLELTVIIWTNMNVTITSQCYKPILLRNSNMAIWFIIAITTHWMKMLIGIPVPKFFRTEYLFLSLLRGKLITVIYHNMNIWNNVLFIWYILCIIWIIHYFKYSFINVINSWIELIDHSVK